MGWGLGWGSGWWALAATRRRNDAEGAKEGAEAKIEKKAPGISERKEERAKKGKTKWWGGGGDCGCGESCPC